jgi:hypothetical protein
MKQVILTFSLLLSLFLCPLVCAQQPVQALGSGVQNSSDAAWTSATGSNTRVTLISNTATYNTIMVTLVQGTTITGGVVTFEQSIDNSTWTTVQGVTLGMTTIMGPTYTLVASTNVSFLLPVNAPYFSVRLSTVITGTGTVTIQHASQTLPAVGLLAGSETLGAGTNVIGHVIADTGSTTAVTQATGTNLHAVTDATSETTLVTTATTTDTALRCTLISAASTNSTNCKASAGNVYGYRFVNTTATLYYLRMYNATSAPTCSSATGFIESIPIPASATGAGIVAIEPMGEGYSTGIGFCFTGGSSSTDATNAATGVFGTILYK